LTFEWRLKAMTATCTSIIHAELKLEIVPIVSQSYIEGK